MSDQDDQNEALDNPRPKDGRKKLIIMLAAFVLLLVCVGGYGAFAFLTHKWPFEPPKPQATANINTVTATDPAADVAASGEQYIRFDSSFTFNLPGQGRRGHMVQVDVALLVVGQANADLASQHLPLISATISEICSQQSYESLISPSGRQRFKRLLLDGVRTKLTGLTNQPIVEQVLFTNFVMQ